MSEKCNHLWNYEETHCVKCGVSEKEFELISEFRKWYNITMGEISELMELKERYKDIFYAVQDRLIDFNRMLNKLENKK